MVGKLGERWKVRIAAPPADGRANAALTRFLSDLLGLPAASVRVVAGSSGREKVVEIEGRDGAEVDAMLAAAATAAEGRS